MLTVLALGVADEISNAIAGETMGKNAGQFWNHGRRRLGMDNFAGFGSSAIAFLFAFVHVIAGLVVWIEILLRSAAIYIAVLFLPGHWPRRSGRRCVSGSRGWSRCSSSIGMKPVIITVLSLAGHAAAAAITGEARGDIGVMLAAHAGLMLGAAAGTLFAVSNVALKALLDPLADGGGAELTAPSLLVALIASLVAFYASARSLQQGEAVPVIALTGAAANVASIAGGFIVFGDPVPAGTVAAFALMLGFASVCVAGLLTPAPLRVAPAAV